MARQSLSNINNNHLLFQNLNNDDFESLNNTDKSDSFPIDMDRLSQLIFNPFETDQNTALSDNNFELDLSFNTNKLQCHYYLPEDFKKIMENENVHEKFSLLHLNIRSISNKFDSLKNLGSIEVKAPPPPPICIGWRIFK